MRLSASVCGVGDSLRRFLGALSDYLTPEFVGQFKHHAELYRWLLQDTENIFQAFCLRWGIDGVIDLHELQIPLCERLGKPSIGTPRILARVDGIVPRGPIVYKMCEYLPRGDELPELDPDADDGPVLAGIDAIFDRMRNGSDRALRETTAHSEVAQIDAGGFRWIRRHPET